VHLLLNKEDNMEVNNNNNNNHTDNPLKWVEELLDPEDR
jgi:hypothetical protein